MTGPRFLSVLALPRDVFPRPPALEPPMYLNQVPPLTYAEMVDAVAQLEAMAVPPIKCRKCGREFYVWLPGTQALAGANSAPLHQLPTTCADCAKDGREVVGIDRREEQRGCVINGKVIQ